MKFGSILQSYRKKMHISQKDLAEKLQVTRNTVVNWENDKSKPDYALIPELCSLLGIHLHELFAMESEIGLDPLEERVVGNLRLLEPGSRRVADRMISAMVDEELALKDARLKESFSLFIVRPGTVAAGVGDDVPDEPPSYTFLRKNTTNLKADGIVKVRGESMEPVYHSGDFVYFRNAVSARPGEDVVVDTDDGAVIKRVGADRTLCSVNEAFPYPQKNEDNSLIIRGIVLGIVQPSDRPSAEDAAVLEELFAKEIAELSEQYGIPAGWN